MGQRHDDHDRDDRDQLEPLRPDPGAQVGGIVEDDALIIVEDLVEQLAGPLDPGAVDQTARHQLFPMRLEKNSPSLCQSVAKKSPMARPKPWMRSAVPCGSFQ